MSSIGISNKQKLTESVGVLPRPPEEIIIKDPGTGLPADAFQDGVGGGGIK